MSNNFEAVKNVTGEKTYNRLLDVMKILGINIPETLRVHLYFGEGIEKGTESSLEDLEEGDIFSYAILLSEVDGPIDEIKEKDLRKLGFIEVSEKSQAITFVRDDIYYRWEKTKEEYEHFEARRVDKKDFKDEFDASFFHYKKGLESSAVSISGTRNLNTIKSYIDELRLSEPKYGTDIGYLDTIDNYLQQVRSQLESNSFVIPDGLPTRFIIETTMQLLEDPINEVVYTLNNTDQSWRFDNERAKIHHAYDEDLRRADFIIGSNLEETAYKRKWAYHRATDEREKKLNEINAKEAQYKSQLKLKQTTTE